MNVIYGASWPVRRLFMRRNSAGVDLIQLRNCLGTAIRAGLDWPPMASLYLRMSPIPAERIHAMGRKAASSRSTRPQRSSHTLSMLRIHITNRSRTTTTSSTPWSAARAP